MLHFQYRSVKMVLVLFLVFSLLFPAASPLRNITHKSCSKFLDDSYQFNNSGAIHLALHHAHGPCSPVETGLPPLQFSDILDGDEARIEVLRHRLLHKTHTINKASSRLPESDIQLTPGRSVGTGNYVVNLGLGTPPKYFVMVVDTGSSLTWVQCEPCRIYCHAQVGPKFDPSTSQTYKSVACNSLECAGLEAATLNPSACSNSNTCLYEASYGDSSYSVGYLSRDTMTLSPSQTLPGFVYGCGQDNDGLFGQSAGLIGLARNKLSLLSQLSSKYGNVFAYCLPTLSSVGFLSVGRNSLSSGYVFTPMLSNSKDPVLYFLRMRGITVGGKALPVSPLLYTRSPMIIDSGTVITRLPPAVYTALQGAFVKGMMRYTRAPPYSILDTCYKGSGRMMSVPEIGLVFEGNAAMRLGPSNVLVDVGNGVTCLAFAGNARADGISIIGNHQQQTFRVVYDVTNSRIGFAAGGCG
ncbi:aspartyl protease family protein At5g10770-like [Tasmannia lanceolata]|uniref:aspartyl protease family protein At5g10770-like n=1 Tax=Tasmannia lanceolata TaxID=3420 RepID=UPI004064432A